MPRSDALQRLASAAGVLAPSPMALKTSSSIPVFKAAVF